jgi:hypothetical protein
MTIIIWETRLNIFNLISSMIAKKIYNDLGADVVETFLDQKYWNYSNTTGKYRNIFLNETIKDTRKKIKSGEYKLTDLNGGYNDNRQKPRGCVAYL